VLAVPPPELAAMLWSRMSGWSLRHRELTAEQLLRDLEKLGPGG
jgi:hypothetical protein